MGLRARAQGESQGSGQGAPAGPRARPEQGPCGQDRARGHDWAARGRRHGWCPDRAEPDSRSFVPRAADPPTRPRPNGAGPAEKASSRRQGGLSQPRRSPERARDVRPTADRDHWPCPAGAASCHADKAREMSTATPPRWSGVLTGAPRRSKVRRSGRRCPQRQVLLRSARCCSASLLALATSVSNELVVDAGALAPTG
jgi:hypothetical protein